MSIVSPVFSNSVRSLLSGVMGGAGEASGVSSLAGAERRSNHSRFDSELPGSACRRISASSMRCSARFVSYQESKASGLVDGVRRPGVDDAPSTAWSCARSWLRSSGGVSGRDSSNLGTGTPGGDSASSVATFRLGELLAGVAAAVERACSSSARRMLAASCLAVSLRSCS
eukprot:466189-Prymnesium_polylepis.1